MDLLIGKTLINAEKFLKENNINYTVKFTGKNSDSNYDSDIVLRTTKKNNSLELLCGKFKLKVNGKGNSDV